MVRNRNKEQVQQLTQAAEAALWYKQLAKTSNTSFLPLFFDQHRYLVLMGGGGSGKSIFAGRKVLERVTSERGHRWLVCRKVARTLRESCFAQLISQLNDYYPQVNYKINRSDLSLWFPDSESKIIMAGLDDVEKLKSIYDLTGIWIEEASELLESDFNQLDIRLRTETPYYKQMILSFNPISIVHWLKKRFWDRLEPKALTHHSTYKDNRFLPSDAVETLEAFKETDEYYYQVYCLGMWGVTGKSVFDAQAVSERLLADIKPLKTGYFTYDDDGLRLTNIQWVDDKDGFIRLYQEVKAGYPYVLGGDTAGAGSDSFVAQVIDNTSGQQVAVLRQQFDEDIYAKQVYCLANYYNTALVGLETNWSTYPVMELERLHYPKQYVRETVDNFTHQIKHSFGFYTNAKTRPLALAGLIKAVREDVTIVNDRTTLEEMLTFVRNEQFRPEAEEGAHDDCIMALAIAHYIRPQQSYLVPEGSKKETFWTPDMLEDYDHATRAERAYLVKKWGIPKRK